MMMKMLLKLLKNSFLIGVSGTVSSGKSSLINSCLGYIATVVNTLETTAVPTLIRLGESTSEFVCYTQQNAVERQPIHALRDFSGLTAKEANLVEITVPQTSPDISKEVCFLDTPGLGSPRAPHHTEAASRVPASIYDIQMHVLRFPAESTKFSVIQHSLEIAPPRLLVLNRCDELLNWDSDIPLWAQRETLVNEVRKRLGEDTQDLVLVCSSIAGLASDLVPDDGFAQVLELSTMADDETLALLSPKTFFRDEQIAKFSLADRKRLVNTFASALKHRCAPDDLPSAWPAVRIALGLTYITQPSNATDLRHEMYEFSGVRCLRSTIRRIIDSGRCDRRRASNLESHPFRDILSLNLPSATLETQSRGGQELLRKLKTRRDSGHVGYQHTIEYLEKVVLPLFQDLSISREKTALICHQHIDTINKSHRLQEAAHEKSD